MWFVALFLCLVAGSRQLSVTEFIVPTSVAAGEEARLSCRYELAPDETEDGLYVKWWWAPLNASDARAQLYQRIMGHEPTALRHNIRVESHDSIVMFGAAPADSGRYECEVSNLMDEVRKHDDLIVYTSGSGPELNVTRVEDGDDGDGEDAVLLSCVAADVAPEPDLVLTVDGEPLVAKATRLPAEDLYEVRVTANVSAARAAGATLACELVFTDTRVTHPQYVHRVPYEIQTKSTTEYALETTTDAAAMPLENPGDDATGLAPFSLMTLAALLIAMVVVN